MSTTLGKKLRNKYPDRIPIIFNCKEDIEISKKKIIVPENISLSQVISIIRKYVSLKKHEALIIFINNTLPQASSNILTLYNEHKNEDDILDIKISKENTFG